MKKTIQNVMTAIVVSIGLLSFASLTVPQASAIDVITPGCNRSGNANNPVCAEAKRGKAPATTLIRNIINTLLFAVSVVAVIAIIIGGFRYMTSNGDSSKIRAAKDTVLYAVVGLVVAILAYTIVQFVINRLT